MPSLHEEPLQAAPFEFSGTRISTLRSDLDDKIKGCAPVRMTNHSSADAVKHGAWRLRKHAEYQLVYKSSRKQQSSSMAFFATARPLPHGTAAVWPTARVGLTAGKVLGNAVERNRIKRRMREAVKANFHLLPAHADVILHPRRTALTVAFPALKAEVEKIFTIVARRMGKPSTEMPLAHQ